MKYALWKSALAPLNILEEDEPDAAALLAIHRGFSSVEEIELADSVSKRWE